MQQGCVTEWRDTSDPSSFAVSQELKNAFAEAQDPKANVGIIKIEIVKGMPT